MSEGEAEKAGFLARWSRRKLAPAPEALAEPTPEAESAAEVAVEPAKPPAACPIPGGPEIDLASLPKLEDLTVASDLTPFLRAGVPSGLRNAALRRMWSLDPEIRDFINSVEYQWDFNAPGGLPNGFSNELLGDVGKMLAQAIGYDPDAKPEDPATAPTPETSPEAIPAPAPEPPSPPRLTLAEAPPPAPEAVPPEAGAPRRRHGSALPG